MIEPQPRSSRVFTVPNLLTFLRLASLPVAVILFRRGAHVAAAAVFLAGMLTDAVDGYLAKLLKQETTLGLYLDPVVDKIVILCIFYELAAAGRFHIAVAHLFLARELLQSAVRSVAAVGGTVVGANRMGKVKACLQTGLATWGLAVSDPSAAIAGAYRLSAWAVLALAWIFFLMFAWWNRRHIGIGRQ